MMKKKKGFLKIFSIAMTISSIIANNVQAIKIDGYTNNLYKEWNIKFNRKVNYSDKITENIFIKDEEGKKINIDIKLKDSNTLTIIPPKEGFKDGKVYTIDISDKIQSMELINLKSSRKFVFKVDKNLKSDGNLDYKYKATVDEFIDKSLNKIVNKGLNSDWEVIALYKNNNDIPKYYTDRMKSDIEKGLLKQPTDYQRTVLLLTALGEDPLNYLGVNYIDKIYNNKEIRRQGINAKIFALIALDSNNYEIPKDTLWTREKLIKGILDDRTENKGWDFAGIKADPDMTAMAITALAPYKHMPEVKEAIDEAIETLKTIQNSDGTFSCYGMKNSESISQVIIGLCANGIDPTESAFTKGGKTLIDNLLTFKISDGGFSHIYNGSIDDKATEQGILALEAYRDFKESGKNVYNLKK